MTDSQHRSYCILLMMILLGVTWMSNKIGSCFQVIDKVRKLSVIYGVNNLWENMKAKLSHLLIGLGALEITPR